MVKKWLRYCFVLVGLVVVSATSVAQVEDGTDPLAGSWRKKEDLSFFIRIVNKDGVYEAEIVRSDWSPGLIGTQFFRDVVNVKKNRWAGEADLLESNRKARVSIKISRSGELTTRLRPGGSVVWVRGEIETKP